MDLYSKQAEENIIGAILIGNKELLEDVKLDYFYDHKSRALIKAIMDLKVKGINADLATITKQLENNKTTIPIHLLPDIISNTLPTEISANIKLLKDLYKRRMTINTLQNAIYQLKDINVNIDNINTSIASKIDSLTFDEETQGDDIKSIVNKLHQDLRQAPSDNEKYRYGISQLDHMTWGLHKEELTTIAAKSGVGKTALAIQIACKLLLSGLRVLIVSREMSDIQIFKRILVSYTGIDSNKFRSRAFTKDEWIRIDKELNAMKNNLDLYINTEISTVTEIKKRTRQLKPDVVIIDYLQLLTPETSEGNREREVATISREIKNMTQDFKIPILQLSQLNDEFGDFRPKGERAMRESKAIYQNSNNVIYIHKPNEKEVKRHLDKNKISMEQFELINEQGNDLVEIILDKQRDGMTGMFLQQYIKKQLTFAQLDLLETDIKTPFEED